MECDAIARSQRRKEVERPRDDTRAGILQSGPGLRVRTTLGPSDHLRFLPALCTKLPPTNSPGNRAQSPFIRQREREREKAPAPESGNAARGGFCLGKEPDTVIPFSLRDEAKRSSLSGERWGTKKFNLSLPTRIHLDATKGDFPHPTHQDAQIDGPLQKPIYLQEVWIGRRLLYRMEGHSRRRKASH